MAVCLAVVVVAAFYVLPDHLNQKGATPPATSEIRVSMENIFLNEIAESLDAARRWYDPELYDNIALDEEAVIDYYKKDLTPAYVPNGLIATSGNGTATVIADKDGEVVQDTVWLGFYHGYYKDASPKLTENVAALKGFFITVSKIGLLNDCIYLLPENEVKASDILGTSVIFGYRSMPYGPYDPQNHEPSGYYDMYAAEFKLNDIEYQIVAEQMKIEELVKVVASIISGEKEIAFY